MSWTLKLDQFSHDVTFTGGKIDRVNGSDEIRQRVKVAVWHYLEEYFLNLPNGVPWYEQILGRKDGAETVSQIIRNKILNVPGVLSINQFQIDYDDFSRIFKIDSDIVVEVGNGEQSTIVNIDFNVNNQGF